jgi:tRNA threonylcarbamoyladenosine biosynthesis protein TsaB
VIILGIDTATPQVGCALYGPDGELASFQAVQGRRHAEILAPAIDFVCKQANVSLDDIGAVAVDIGPGLFTGLRVGVATGNALASALDVPMVGLTSLDLLAAAAGHQPDRRIAAVVDARRAEVYWALYQSNPDRPVQLTEYAVHPPAAVAEQLAQQSDGCLGVGDGALRYGDQLTTGTKVEVAGPELAYPSVSVLVRLARPLAVEGRTTAPGTLTPLYLRKADVRINWQQRDTKLEEGR